MVSEDQDGNKACQSKQPNSTVERRRRMHQQQNPPINVGSVRCVTGRQYGACVRMCVCCCCSVQPTTTNLPLPLHQKVNGLEGYLGGGGGACATVNRESYRHKALPCPPRGHAVENLEEWRGDFREGEEGGYVQAGHGTVVVPAVAPEAQNSKP